MSREERMLTVSMHNLVREVTGGDCNRDFFTVMNNSSSLTRDAIFSALSIHLRLHRIEAKGGDIDVVIRDAVEKWIEENIELIGKFVFCGNWIE
jgi:hypothetical protein